MADLVNTVQQIMEGYAVKAANGYSYLTRSMDGQMFTVVYIGNVRGETVIDTGLVTRLQDNKIIIEHDANSKPLVDALLQAGIPRDQIILAYAGEPAPEPS